jgi:hypothetical protein
LLIRLPFAGETETNQPGIPQANQENELAYPASIELAILTFDAIIANRLPVCSF